MRTLKICLYELIAALSLLGIIYLYSEFQADPHMIYPRATKTALIAIYALIAATSEAMIASGFRPGVWHVLGPNVLVAAIISVPGWIGTTSLAPLAFTALATLFLRLLAAAISQRTPKATLHRIISGLVGSPLLLAGVGIAYIVGDDLYENYYLLPRIKERYIMPARWQDFVAIGGLSVGAVVLFYLSYRLLKYAFRRESRTGT